MTTLTLTPDPANGRVRCIVQDAQGGTLTRDGTPVRGGESVTGDLIVDDYEAPFGITLTYTIEDSGDQTTVLEVASSWLSTATQPGMPVTVRDQDPRTYRAPGRTYAILGSRWPLAVHTTRQVHEGTLDLLTDQDTSTMLRDLLASGAPLLLRTPTGCTVDTMWLWASEVTRTRLGNPTSPAWTWSLDYQRVEGPAGSVTIDPDNAWSAVVVTHPTWTDLVATHADWLDVQITPHPHT